MIYEIIAEILKEEGFTVRRSTRSPTSDPLIIDNKYELYVHVDETRFFVHSMDAFGYRQYLLADPEVFQKLIQDMLIKKES